MKIVKYRCKKCGYAEEYSRKERILKNLGKIVTTLIFVLGFFMALYLILVGPMTAISSISTSLLLKFTTDNEMTHDELRHQAIEWTNHCEPYDQLCYALAVFDNLDHIPYVQASLISPLQSPSETYNYGGDCKNTAILYTTTMLSVGADSMILCSAKYSHCVSLVPDTERGLFYVVDLTIPGIYAMNNEDNAWDYMEIGTRLWGFENES